MTAPIIAKRKVRLAYLVSRYPAVSHTFILREVLSLREHGIEIEVASINPPDRPTENLTKEERDEAAKTFCVKKAGVAGALIAQARIFTQKPVCYLRGLAFAIRLGGSDPAKVAMSLFYFVEAAMIAHWMQRKAMDHLHVHFATPAATVALILARMCPIRFSLTVHGPDEFYDVPGYHLTQKVESASFICAIGLYARSQLMKVSPVQHWDKIEISPLGVDSECFTPRPFRAAPELFEVLCVGRLVAAKGQHILLRAMHEMARAGYKVLVRFVGDGPDRKALESEAARLGIAQYVRFEGAVNQDRIREFYRTADVFALASFAEGIPVVLMEAMAMEVPCVTTWITGVPELIRHEVDGLLVAPSDAAGLAQAISRMIGDDDLRKRLGEAGRQRVREKFDLDRNVRHLAEIFTRRLAGEQP
jgi:glycosyltransferase involved in cell wall biosynthesis